ncbi:MAG TPA: hypothetical protein VF334_06490, partial [Polyangia bacterium]
MRYHGIIREPATSAQAHVAATDDALASESRSAFELLTRAVAGLEPLGGAGEIEPACARLGALLARDHALVELAGGQRSLAVDALVGAHLLAPTVAASVTIRVRAATAFGYEVRWPDGRVEVPPPDEHDHYAAALATFEREVLAPAAEAARVAGERLQKKARVVVHARAEAARAESARVEAARVETARAETARAEAERAEAARAHAAAARRSWLGRLFARFVVWLRALFGRAAPSLPTPAAPQPLPALHPPTPLPANDDALGSLEAAL